MRNRNKTVQIVILLAVLIVAGLTLGNNLLKDKDAIPRVGDKAPDFKLTALDGQSYQLSDLLGKVVIVNFWGTFCPPCVKEMPDLQKQHEQWKDSDVVILGVNVMGESKVTVQSFIEQVKVTFPILLDPEDRTRKRYGVSDFPTTVIIRPDGKIKEIKSGPVDQDYLQKTVAGIMPK